MQRWILRLEPRLLGLPMRSNMGMVVHVPLPKPLTRSSVFGPLVAGPAVRPDQEFDGVLVLGLAQNHLAHDVDDGDACVDINQ